MSKMRVKLGSVFDNKYKEIETTKYNIDDFKIGDIKRYYIKLENVPVFWFLGVVKEIDNKSIKFDIIYANLISTRCNSKIYSIDEIVYIEPVRFSKDSNIRNLMRRGDLEQARKELGYISQKEFCELLNQKFTPAYKAVFTDKGLLSIITMKSNPLNIFSSLENVVCEGKFTKNQAQLFGYPELYYEKHEYKGICFKKEFYTPQFQHDLTEEEEKEYQAKKEDCLTISLTMKDLEVVFNSLRIE